MDKYGVADNAEMLKQAAMEDKLQCPRCGRTAQIAGTIPHCPNCGTLPWERTNAKRQKSDDTGIR